MQKKVVCLFPGQGSQYQGMGKDLYESFPVFRETIEAASDYLGFDMAKLCFEDPDGKLSQTEFTQPSILTVSVGLQNILKKECGFVPEIVAGHSLGEYSALVAISALSFEEAVKAVQFRGRSMQKAVPLGVGAMAACLGGDARSIAEMCENISNEGLEKVEVVNYNSPSQFVISGHKIAVEKAIAKVSELKMGRAKMLSVSAPFHSSLMKPAAEEMANYLSEKVSIKQFQGKIVANVDAKAYSSPFYGLNILVKQIAHPVLWTQSLENIRNLNQDNQAEVSWVEVGPGNVLQGLLKKTFSEEKAWPTDSVENVKGFISKCNF